MNKLILSCLSLVGLLALVLAAAYPGYWLGSPAEKPKEYIVQAGNSTDAVIAIREVSGVPLAKLNIINSHTALLTTAQRNALESRRGLRVFANRPVGVMGMTDALRELAGLPGSDGDAEQSEASQDDEAAASNADGEQASNGSETDAPPAEDSGNESAGPDEGAPADEPAPSEETAKKGADAPSWNQHYAHQVSATALHRSGIDGSGVTIAIVDSGITSLRELTETSSGRDRLLAYKDVLTGYSFHSDDGKGKAKKNSSGVQDPHGHGTHVISVAVSSEMNDDGSYAGVAPGADIVVARAFDDQGRGTYADVIAAIDWIVTNRARHNIRVLNLSFSAQVASWYWDDPMNQAVMAAWDAGIATVVSAGNAGPASMSIGVPGNLPYVITVGSLHDNFTPNKLGDDFLSVFSATGPTHEGFIKPDLLAPGGQLLGLMRSNSTLAKDHRKYLHVSGKSFQMSGTSQSAAVVSGAVALMLQADPTLGPDTVKCRLMETAAAALNAQGLAHYSVFQQGAGRADAERATRSDSFACANRGLDIKADREGSAHYGGPIRQDDDGNYYLIDPDSGEHVPFDGYVWDQGYLWKGPQAWSQGYLWGKGGGGVANQGYLWKGTGVRPQGYLWKGSGVSPSATAAGVDDWVEPEPAR